MGNDTRDKSVWYARLASQTTKGMVLRCRKFTEAKKDVSAAAAPVILLPSLAAYLVADPV